MQQTQPRFPYITNRYNVASYRITFWLSQKKRNGGFSVLSNIFRYFPISWFHMIKYLRRKWVTPRSLKLILCGLPFEALDFSIWHRLSKSNAVVSFIIMFFLCSVFAQNNAQNSTPYKMPFKIRLRVKTAENSKDSWNGQRIRIS